MSYSYSNTLASDTDLVRFHIGDNHDDGHYLENEEIQYWVDEASTIGEAVIHCIQYIITQLSSPNFKKDWLSVSNEKAREGYEKMLIEKRQQLGVTSINASTTISLPYRADSFQDSSESVYGG